MAKFRKKKGGINAHIIYNVETEVPNVYLTNIDVIIFHVQRYIKRFYD